MAMEPKTLDTIFSETDAFHKRLVAHLRRCKDQAPNERERMLLDFICGHEHWLACSLEGLEHSQYESALDTWFYEYTDRHAILFSNPEDIPFEQMNYDDICEKIRLINNDIIDLFKHLKKRAESKSGEEALDQLLTHLTTNAKNLSQETANTAGL